MGHDCEGLLTTLSALTVSTIIDDQDALNFLYHFTSRLREKVEEALHDPHIDESMRKALQFQIQFIDGVKVNLDRIDIQQTMTSSQLDSIKRNLRRSCIEVKTLKDEIESLRVQKEKAEEEAKRERIRRENVEKVSKERLISLQREGEATLAKERLIRERAQREAEEASRVREEERLKRKRAEGKAQDQISKARQETRRECNSAVEKTMFTGIAGGSAAFLTGAAVACPPLAVGGWCVAAGSILFGGITQMFK